MNHSLITFRPYGGLANRMRAIAAGVALSKDIKKPIHIVWISEKGLKCNYEHIFKSHNDFSIESNPSMSFIKFLPYYQSYKYLHPFINIEKIGQLFYNKYLYGTVTIPKEYDNELSNYKSIYITSCYEFRKAFPVKDLFDPVDSIQELVNKKMDKIKENCIGVHIRRTDNHFSINQSPLHSFYELMQKSIEDNIMTNFFLATDCPETENNLKKRFGNRIHMNKKVLDRNSPQGIYDAVVDMYCLSKTEKIIGSSESSYSEMASKLSSIPLIIAK